ncbi:uncharacterized protein LOC119737915 isoform X3 [Patiria miniata]|uniref:Uncharacterized protein n=1 Tax=Patiria miniata TaxID=46514 RepID=A0A914AXS2_PATMI|nr:uncharacterized protein LOC119737915 isoform X3 [Patiria miniata]
MLWNATRDSSFTLIGCFTRIPKKVKKMFMMSWWIVCILSSFLGFTNLSAFTQTTAGPCPEEYVLGPNGSCYWFYHDVNDTNWWYYSRGACQNRGSDLLIIDSQEELDYILNQTQTLAPDQTWWIGYYDVSVEGTWRWVDCSDTSDWQSTLWVSGEPAIRKDCGILLGGTGQLSSEICDEKFNFICEVSPKDFTIADTNARNVKAVAINETAIRVTWDVSPYNCDVFGYRVHYQQYREPSNAGFVQVYEGSANETILSPLYATNAMWQIYVAGMQIEKELEKVGPAEVWFGPCPEWHIPGPNGTCYWFYHDVNDTNWWYYSRGACQDRGSDLLIIDSQEELDYILNQTQILAPGQTWWIGYYDVSVEGTWRWVDCSDTSDWQSTLWVSGEPAIRKDCGILLGGTGQLSSEICDEKFNFICEVSPKDFTLADTNARNVKAVAINETAIRVTWDVSPYNCDVFGYRVHYQQYQEPSNAGFVQVYKGSANETILSPLYATNVMWQIYVAGMQIEEELDKVGPAEVWLGPCPEWHLPGPNGSCYWFYHDVNDTNWWYYSRGACQNRGSDLLIIDSQEELDYILNQTQILAPDQTWWIGYYDVSVEGTWRWVDCSDTSDWQSTLWVSGEPAIGKDCGILLGATGQLSSEICDEKFNFICEVSPKGFLQVYEGNANETILSPLTTNVWWQIYVAGMQIEEELDKVGPAEVWLGPCPGWHLPGPNNSCYWFYHDPNNTGWWSSRRNSCLNRGSDLLIIDNQEELDYILNQTETLAPDQTWWIGYYDVSVEGTWRWVDCSDTSDWQSTLWVPGEPALRKDCGILLGGTGQLSSEICDEKFNFICEVSPKDFTEEDTKPTNVAAVAMTPFSVKVTWDVSADNCDVIGYRVHYFKTSDKNQKGSQTVYEGNANNTLLSSLETNTEYSIGVAVINLNEELEQVGPVLVTTPWGCPDGYEEGPERSCFAFLNFTRPWGVARQYCQDVANGDLAIIDSQPELEFVQRRMQEVNPGQMWWIGYDDISVEGDWRWLDCQPTAEWQLPLWPSDEPRFATKDCGYIRESESAVEIRSANCGENKYILCEITDKGFVPEDGNARNVRASPLTPASFEVKWDGSPTSCDVIGYSIFYSKETSPSEEELETVYGGEARDAQIEVAMVSQDTVYLVSVAGLNWLGVLSRIGPVRVTLTPESDNREYFSLTGDSGAITSPGWPTSYENNKDITWTITVTKPGRVLLTIVSIRLDPSGDYLTVGSGATSGVNELGRYTGHKENVGTLESQFNQMWLRFITDSTITAQGFSVTFEKLDDGPVEDCGRAFTDLPSGTITSPNFLDSKPYPNNAACVWTISLLDKMALVELSFTTFDLERDQDFLVIGSGLTVNENILQWLTGQHDSRTVMSPTHEMWLHFISDESQSGQGFRAMFTSKAGEPPTTPVYKATDSVLFVVFNQNVGWFDAVNQVQLASTIAEVLNRYNVAGQTETRQQGDFDASDVVFVSFYNVDSDLHIVTWVRDATWADPKAPLNPDTVIAAVTSESEYFQTSMGESFEYKLQRAVTPEPSAAPSGLEDWVIAVIAVGALLMLVLVGLGVFGCGKSSQDKQSAKKDERTRGGNEHDDFRPTSFGSDGTWNPAFHPVVDDTEPEDDEEPPAVTVL